jgi:glyoxylate reductase
MKFTAPRSGWSVLGASAGGWRSARLASTCACSITTRGRKTAPELNATRVDFETLLEESDFISLHTPLTPDTRHMIDSEALSRMKPNAVLVNTSRGPVVDMEALYEALRDKRIFAAALDVTDPEPLPSNHPLLTLDNLVIAPHIASASHTARGNMAWKAARNLIAGLKGERLPNCVNPQVYK